jgi:hypothetical protein
MTPGMPSVPLTVLVVIGAGSPALLLALLGSASLVNRPLSERWTGLLAGSSMALACVALLIAFAVYGMTRPGTQLLSYGAWSTAHKGGIAIEFLVDRISLAFAALTTAIAGVVSAFSNRYLHRDSGYNRYFVLLTMFVTGMLLVALAGNVAVLFIGWELVGLSSALLVAFFHDRPAAVSNAFRMISVYRISDAAMLSAAVLLRHVAGTDSLMLLFGREGSTTGLTASNATLIASLLIVAVACKSALLPFSSWLPRAMEGTHTIKRRLLWVPLDSRRVFSAAASGTAARTNTCGAYAGRRARCNNGVVCRDHHARTERREIIAGVRIPHASRPHRRRNRDRLVHDCFRSSGGTRLLSAAAIHERAERPSRLARTRRGHR